MAHHNSKSALAGIMITAGSAIGAGMFSLPIVASGMWFSWSLFSLLLIWFVSYLSAIYILELNFYFAPGASFNTIVEGILGKTWNILTGLSIAFLLYILLYAYFSAFGNIAAHGLNWEPLQENRWLQGLASLAMGTVLAVIIWWSTSMVGKISTVLVIGMIIAYFLSMTGLGLQIEASKLFNTASTNTNYTSYLWVALPYFITAFGFSTVVPSLYKHYGKEPGIIKKSLLYGSLIAFLVYTLFLLVSFGNISRDAFIEVNAAGGNMGVLVNALEKGNGHSFINYALNLFSNFAIITSFLGVGLSLFDYIADMFSFPDTKKGRLYSACIAFLPSGLASFFFPDGFIAAIGFAGLVVLFGFFIVPYIMILKTRKKSKAHLFKVGGGNLLLHSFLLVSLLVATCYILAMLNYLPKW